eukprot:NODE_3630_length_762_cov_123.700141.p1 GENE.NODE_3630_length_762_cov_123.700141~~NODE_3630_length_762_cov_123.700141.p1  ORF type:complete len:186 (-),score=77.33 NODE_3630_length_762_cov_123.700141:187-744(-)
MGRLEVEVSDGASAIRDGHTAAAVFLGLVLFPFAMLSGGIFYWVSTALSGLIETLVEQGQKEKLAVFRALWWILLFTLTLGTLALLCRIYGFSHDISNRWQHEWLFTDAASHILFGVVLAAIMYFWMPNENSQKYVYMVPLSGDPDTGQLFEEDEENMAERSSLVGTDVVPEVIGSTADGDNYGI